MTRLERQRARRAELRRRGLCLDCTEISGKFWYCGACRLRRAKRAKPFTDAQKAQHRALQLRRRAAWRAAGLCSRCGAQTDGTHTTCDYCRGYDALRRAA